MGTAARNMARGALAPPAHAVACRLNLHLCARADRSSRRLIQVIQQCLTQAESTRLCGTEPSRLLGQAGREHKAHLALDGKTMRGTLSHEAVTQSSVHLLSLYEVSTGIVLAERAVQTKENEINAVSDLLLPALIKGRIWSA